MQLPQIVDVITRRKKTIPSGLRMPPRLAGGLPVIGHAVEFIKNTNELLARAQREHGEICGFTLFHRKIVAMFGPEAHEAVFRAPDEQLSAQEAYKIMTPVFGKDMVYDASPEKMAEQLKMLLPALKDRRMRTYGEAVVYEVEQTTAPWGESGMLDFVDFTRVLTNFTSSRCLLGNEFREGMTEEFASVYHDLEQGVTPIAYLNAHLPLPSFIRRDRARVRMVEMINKVVNDRRASKREGEDFLQTLMESKYSDGRPLNEDEITGMLLAAMFAGHHTSSVTTAWALIELLQNPDYLKRVVEEIDRVFGGGEAVSHQSLRELIVTENAVKEALRLHPPLFMLVRVAVQDFDYKGYYIPKGTWILVSPTVAHRIPEVFKDPDRFDPDRFLPPREEDKRDYAFISFGGGRHKCLGNAFAILQVKAILALLLGQYEFELAGDPIEPNFKGLVVGPKEPCRVRYQRRAHPSVHAADGAAKALGRAVREMAGVAPPAGCPAHAHGNGAQVAAEAMAAGCPAHSEEKKTGTGTGTGSVAEGKRLKVILDRDLCQGHAVCVGEAPEVFKLGSDGKVTLVTEEIPTSLNAKVRAAAKYCPTRTIRVQEI
jgi:sterol 14-demethylase